jgi:hypothetical protein
MALNVDTACGFKTEGGYATRTWIFFGKEEWVPEVFTFYAYYRSRQYSWNEPISKEEFDRMTLHQRHTPHFMLTIGHRNWWWFGDAFYYTPEAFSDPIVIKGLILQKEQRARNKEERARAAASGEPPPPAGKSRRKYGPRVPVAQRSYQSPYEILGVLPTASFSEIKTAYRKRMTEYHPDKVAALGSALRELAEEMTKQINNAYEELAANHNT